MMRTLMSCLAFFLSIVTSAQSMREDGSISIKAIMPTDGISSQVGHNIETRMQTMLTKSGYADNNYSERFVLTAKFDVIQKDVVASTPARISEKLDVTFMVGDVVENKIYTACTIPVSGIGVTEEKTLISAFSKINPNMKLFSDMLAEAKSKIKVFYTKNYRNIVAQAKSMAARGQYDEAISELLSVPSVCGDCYDDSQKQAADIYRQKIDAEAITNLNKARNIWMVHKDVDGATQVAKCLSAISPYSSKYGEAIELRNEVAEEIKKQQQREWNFQMQQYQDSQENKRAVIKACRDVAVAWISNQPKNIIQTVVRSWW